MMLEYRQLKIVGSTLITIVFGALAQSKLLSYYKAKYLSKDLNLELVPIQ